MMGGVLMILGGPPRCGKTLLAQQVASERGTGWLSTDTIRDVVAMQMPELYEAAGPGNSHDPEADLFFPYFEKVAESCNYLVDEYLIEGVGFMPRHVAALPARIELRAVFVGMVHVELGRCSQLRAAIFGTAISTTRHSRSCRRGSSLGAEGLRTSARASIFRMSSSAATSTPASSARSVSSWDPRARADVTDRAVVGSWGGGGRRVGPWVWVRCLG
jgi:hypothetical protein